MLATWYNFPVSTNGGMAGMKVCHQDRTGGGTHGTSRVVLCEPDPLLRQPVQVRCFNLLPAIRAQVSVTHIIRENVDDVGTGTECRIFLIPPILIRTGDQSSCKKEEDP